MASYNTKGTISIIGETKQVSDKFRKRSVIVEVQDGKYPQTVEFQATGDRCDLVGSLNEGEEVSIDWNLRGRAWSPPNGGETKYFVTCDIWKIERIGAAKSSSAPKPTAPNGSGSDGMDDLPF
jgi:hypothetical protein